MIKICKLYIDFISAVNNRLEVLAWVLPAMIFIMLYEVIARYAFNSPTVWAWDVNTQLLCLFTALVGGYTLYRQGHIRSDLFYSRWSVKRKALVDLLTSFLLILFTGAAVFGAANLAIRSLHFKEHSSTILMAPVYPIRILIAVGAFLFLLQVIAEVMRNFLIVTGKLNPREQTK